MHQLPDGRVVDLLGRGDERHAAFLKLGHNDGVVNAVAGEAIELVDDDVVDVLLAADALQHLLERHALLHLCAASPGFDVLLDDREAELVSLAATCNPLGR
nr:hypothetical protein [Microbacterium sp. SORGH_AS_0888]